MLFNCDKLWIENAKHVQGSYTNYYEAYLQHAVDGTAGYFVKDYFPVVVFAVCLFAGLFKLAHCGLLIFQKYYARSVNNRQRVEIAQQPEQYEQYAYPAE